MLRDLEAFLRYVTLIDVRFYLLTYLLAVYAASHWHCANRVTHVQVVYVCTAMKRR